MTDKTLEAVARAISDAEDLAYGPPLSWDLINQRTQAKYKNLARAAIQAYQQAVASESVPAIPAGWKLVRETTAERYGIKTQADLDAFFAKVDAMLSAAPTPEAENDPAI